jgi:hypothetical protein
VPVGAPDVDITFALRATLVPALTCDKEAETVVVVDEGVFFVNAIVNVIVHWPVWIVGLGLAVIVGGPSAGGPPERSYAGI